MSDKEFLINSGDANRYAKYRKSLTFKDLVVMALTEYAQNEQRYKQFKDYFSVGGGRSWNDILKAVLDDSDEGKKYVEIFRQMTEAELLSRGVFCGEEVEKPIPKWE